MRLTRTSGSYYRGVVPHRCRSHEKLRAIREELQALEDDDGWGCPDWHDHETFSPSFWIDDFSSAGLRAWSVGLEACDFPGYGTGLDADDIAGLTDSDVAIALVIG